MIHRRATQVGSPLIRAKAKRVVNPTGAANRKVVKDLIDSMHHHGLVGMAAPQIGKSLRIFVTEPRDTKVRKVRGPKAQGPCVFINPCIVTSSKAQSTGWEGCGSVADKGLFAQVRRPTSVTVEAYDTEGKKFTLRAKGLLARIIGHEMDHLNGIVFTDKADRTTYTSREEYLKIRK